MTALGQDVTRGALQARSTVTIDLRAIRDNVEVLRELARPAELWAVVKADAYGHGAMQAATAALSAGAAAVCVATAGEALVLRKSIKDARIIVLGPSSASEHEAVRASGAELVLGAGPVPEGVSIHLKVDTGMGRAGVRPEDVPDALPRNTVGIMTHLAAADSAKDDAFTGDQLDCFERVADQFPGIPRHAANTAATLRFDRSHYDAVRCGIGIYGLSPFADRPSGVGLRPALSWHCRIVATKTLRAGESTGYGRRYIAKEPVLVGLVPVGYGDGFPRALRDAHVMVDGQLCQVLGTPSMDSFVVRLPTGSGTGSDVTIVGEGVSAQEHACAAGTLNYEFVCSVGRDPLRCERVFVNG